MRGTELRQHHPQVKLIRWHTRRAPPPDSRAACGGNPRRARVRCNGGNALYGPRRPVRHRCARGNENAGSCNKPWHTGEVSLGLETGDSPGEALVIKISGGLPSCPSRIPITTLSGAIGYRGRARQAPLCRSVDVHNGGRPPLSWPPSMDAHLSEDDTFRTDAHASGAAHSLRWHPLASGLGPGLPGPIIPAPGAPIVLICLALFRHTDRT